MLFLLDTNVALRLVNPGVPSHARLVSAIDRLAHAGHRPCFVPQNVVEMWSVCTRPAANNGLGLSVTETDARVKRLESKFLFLPDSDGIHLEWRRLVVAHAVSGIQVHDARLVAAMNVHGIRHLLTLNPRDFRRYGVEVLEPAEILAGQ